MNSPTPRTTAELLAALERPLDALITLDWETYYAPDYTVRKLTTEGYVRDARFEPIGVGVKVNDDPAVWMSDTDFRVWARTVDWSRVACLAHHAHFDGLIASWHYGIHPALWLCTLSMGRALHRAIVGGSLGALALHYGAGEKGDEVVRALGKRRRDFTAEEWLRYGDYCRQDCELTWRIYHDMEPDIPEVELYAIDMTVRMFTEPALTLDVPLLEGFLREEGIRKAEFLRAGGVKKATLMSNKKFAAALATMGVEPPRKTSPRTGKETFAFAKSDPGMAELLEHGIDEVRWLAEARVAVKSTIGESRAARILAAGTRGPVPVYLKYSGAHTHRWSGGDKANYQNLNRVKGKCSLSPGHEGAHK